MSLENDRKRQQIHADAVRSNFHDPEINKLIKNPGFTVIRFRVHAERLIGLAEAVEAKHARAVAEAEAKAKTEGKEAADPVAMSKLDEHIVLDGANARDILASIKRIGA